MDWLLCLLTEQFYIPALFFFKDTGQSSSVAMANHGPCGRANKGLLCPLTKSSPKVRLRHASPVGKNSMQN